MKITKSVDGIPRVSLKLEARLSARLRSVNGIKNKPYVSKLTKNWSSVFGGFKKTMIACQSIKQAAEVEKFLRSLPVSAALGKALGGS